MAKSKFRDNDGCLTDNVLEVVIQLLNEDSDFKKIATDEFYKRENVILYIQKKFKTYKLDELDINDILGEYAAKYGDLKNFDFQGG